MVIVKLSRNPTTNYKDTSYRKLFKSHAYNPLTFLRLVLETDAKKSSLAKNFATKKVYIQAILPSHELVILTKFHNDWIKIVHLY